jgi:uncharacterized protein YfdQ (DUF2303 family)
MDANAINTIADLAVAANNGAHLGTPTPALFHAGKLTSIEHLQAGRARFRGRMTTSSLADFAGYIAARAAAALKPACFIDANATSAKCYFNLGTDELPGHADDIAELTLTPTAAFAAICALDGHRLAQRALAEFVEEWSQHISATTSDGEALPLSAAVVAIRNIQIKQRSESTSTVGNFNTSRSALDEIEARANGTIELPGALYFRVTPYAGLTEQIAELRLSIITSEEKPVFAVRWNRREQMREDIAQDFKRVVTSAIGGTASVIVGTFTP